MPIRVRVSTGSSYGDAMTIFQRIIAWFRKLFGKPDHVVEANNMTTVTTTEMPSPEPEDKVDPITRSYGKYKRWMKKHGMMPGSRKNFVIGKNPLHYAHFGTFSPLKPIKGNTNFDRTADIHRERLRMGLV